MPAPKPFVTTEPTHPDLAYASLSEAQRLDLYLPPGPGPFPVVLALHGGGFKGGDKRRGSGLAGADALLAAGYAVASANYRLSGEAIWPAPLHDCKAAVRFLRAEAGRYNLRRRKVGVWGASAGGHLAAMLGASCGVTELEGLELGHVEQSSCVQAVIDWFGPVDFLTMDAQFEGTGHPMTHNDPDSPESLLMGAPIQTVPLKVRMANPVTYVTTLAPPCLIQHGTADHHIPPVQGKQLAEAWAVAIGPEHVTYTLFEGAGHADWQFSTDENLALMVAFLDRYLR